MKIIFVTLGLFLFVMFSVSLHGNELVSFDQLKEKNLQKITIRGFLYKSQDGTVILAKEPDLKSCCVGSTKKVLSQLVVLGDMGDLGQNRYGLVVTLKGVLTHKSMTDEQGSVMLRYELTNVTVVKNETFSGYGIVGILLAVLCGIVLILYWKTKKTN